MEWRRRDQHPEQKKIIVQDAQTSKIISNVKTIEITREKGILLFEPISGKGTYYVYYMSLWQKKYGNCTIYTSCGCRFCYFFIRKKTYFKTRWVSCVDTNFFYSRNDLYRYTAK
ncbi:glycoside hydrolase domain-containing protein [Tenacibaculum sp. UWU-22]|uniref:glycoside hydrolase domain-containing protein n=1 Tax=Tenacibaculum sp. UWU-22 TaxID=3234187 RepID=UPI0034DB529D